MPAVDTIRSQGDVGLRTGAECLALRQALGRTLREVGSEAGVHLTPVRAFERERVRLFRRQCSGWNARGLGRLSVEKFAVAVNEILRRPVLYACIEPRATVSPVLDEGD